MVTSNQLSSRFMSGKGPKFQEYYFFSGTSIGAVDV